MQMQIKHLFTANSKLLQSRKAADDSAEAIIWVKARIKHKAYMPYEKNQPCGWVKTIRILPCTEVLFEDPLFHIQQKTAIHDLRHWRRSLSHLSLSNWCRPHYDRAAAGRRTAARTDPPKPPFPSLGQPSAGGGSFSPAHASRAEVGRVLGRSCRTWVQTAWLCVKQHGTSTSVTEPLHQGQASQLDSSRCIPSASASANNCHPCQNLT